MEQSVNVHLITGRETATIIRPLSETELQELGGKIANQVVLMEEREEAWKIESKARTEEKKADTIHLKELAKRRKTGHFEGEMEVGLVLSGENSKYMLQVDLETGEVLGQRLSTVAERQHSIDFSDNIRDIKAS